MNANAIVDQLLDEARCDWCKGSHEPDARPNTWKDITHFFWNNGVNDVQIMRQGRAWMMQVGKGLHPVGSFGGRGITRVSEMTYGEWLEEYRRLKRDLHVRHGMHESEPASPYDIDSNKLDVPEYPEGIAAVWPDDESERLEWRADPAGKSYRMSKFWLDDYTGKPRVAANIASTRVSAYRAAKWLEREAAALTAKGWKVSKL